MKPTLPRNTPLRTDDEIVAAYEKGLLKKEDLVDGRYYKGSCRNASVARWNAAQGVFLYMRTKFNFRFPESIKHPFDDRVYDVFLCVDEATPDESQIIQEDTFGNWK